MTQATTGINLENTTLSEKARQEKNCVLHGSAYMKRPEETDPQRQKVSVCLAESMGEGGVYGDCLMGVGPVWE